MKICVKRQALLLSIALIPMAICALIYRQSMHKLGERLATKTKVTLSQNAYGRLRTLVFDYGRVVNRDQRAIERGGPYRS